MIGEIPKPDNTTSAETPEIQVENTLMQEITHDGQVCLARVSRLKNDDLQVNIVFSLERAFLTVNEAAELLTVSRTTVRHLVQKGALVKRQVGHETRITWESFIAFLELECRSPN